MRNILNNKRGELLLRNIIPLLLIFSVTIGLISLFVEDMSNEYNNDAMKNEYFNSGINSTGKNITDNVYNDTEEMLIDADDMEIVSDSGAFSITRIVSIVKKILFAPTYFAGAIGNLLSAVNVPEVFVFTIKFLIQAMLYALILFVIAGAAMRGSKV